MEPENKNWFQRLLEFEPARVRAIIAALVALAAIWGFNISGIGDQVGGSWELLYALIPLVLGEVIRPAVRPEKRVVAALDSEGNTVATERSEVPTGRRVRVALVDPTADEDDTSAS